MFSEYRMAECLKWEENFAVWLSKKINDVIVDKDDQWRTKLFNDIISMIGKNFKYKNFPCKAILVTEPLKTPVAEGIFNYSQSNEISLMLFK